MTLFKKPGWFILGIAFLGSLGIMSFLDSSPQEEWSEPVPAPVVASTQSRRHDELMRLKSLKNAASSPLPQGIASESSERAG